jgi:hypothetical protein
MKKGTVMRQRQNYLSALVPFEIRPAEDLSLFVAESEKRRSKSKDIRTNSVRV